MATVQIRQLIEFVLNNPKNYSGIHNASQPRTTQGLPQLDPSRQMLLIWDGMCAYVEEILGQGKSVNVKNFGAFTYEPIVAAGGNQITRADTRSGSGRASSPPTPSRRRSTGTPARRRWRRRTAPSTSRASA